MAKKKVRKVGVAQLKTAFIVIYYIIIGVSGMVVYTDSSTGSPYERIRDFVECENSGASECVLEGGLTLATDIISTTIFVIISLLPVVAILFTCDPKVFKKKSDLKGGTRPITFAMANTRTSTTTLNL